jgi:ABC-type spermidine/putrescine transport system permease subunit I
MHVKKRFIDTSTTSRVPDYWNNFSASICFSPGTNFWTYESSFVSKPILTFANYAKIFSGHLLSWVYLRTIKLSLISTGITLLLSYPLPDSSLG